MRPLLAVALLASLIGGLLAYGRWLSNSIIVSSGELDAIPVEGASTRPSSVVIYLSDRTGWSGVDEDLTDALAASGSMVLKVDFASYARRLDGWDGQCLYVVGDLTDLVQLAQKQAGVDTYRMPIVVGRGQGATFAYAAVAGAPANTLGGAVGIDFENSLSLRLPFCPGASSMRLPLGEGYRYAFDRPLPAPGTLLVRQPDAAALAGSSSLRGLNLVPIALGDKPSQAVDAVSAIAKNVSSIDDLPAIDLPSRSPPKAVAVIVSGDGGWRDLDKTIGEWLASQGLHVVGLDAVRYFWTKRTPEALAKDLEKLIAAADPTASLPVLLIGYSFGADTVPFAYGKLSVTIRDRVATIALLAPGQTTSFEITVAGWLGWKDSGFDVVGAMRSLPTHKLVCFWGSEDTESGCPRLGPGFEVVTTSGGHHFDGDYVAIAHRIAATVSK